MKIVSYIPIDAVLTNVYSIIDEDLIDEADLLEWASIAMRSLRVKQTYDLKVTFVKVENYKSTLPKGTLWIDQIFYAEQLDENDAIQIKLYTGDEDSITTKYWEFLDSNYYNHRWRPLRATTTPFHRGIHCSDCINFICEAEHSYSIDKCGIITTSFEKGYLSIAHYAYPIINGSFLIPDDVDVIKALEAYILYRVWEKKWNSMIEGAERRYHEYKNRWQLASAKARGQMLLPSIDEYENLKQQLLRLGQNTNSYYNGFGTLAQGEEIDFNWSSGSFFSGGHSNQNV